MEAASPYAAWSELRQADNPLEVGDMLEQPDGGLRILKYVGFEEARWMRPENEPGGEEGIAPAGEPIRTA